MVFVVGSPQYVCPDGLSRNNGDDNKSNGERRRDFMEAKHEKKIAYTL